MHLLRYFYLFITFYYDRFRALISQIKPGMEEIPSKVSLPVYAGPEQRFCPARVYEYTDGG